MIFKKPKTYLDKLKSELIVFFAFFIITLMAGVYSLRYPNMVALPVILLTFLVFNGFNILINLILKSTKAIVNNGTN